MKIEVDEFNNEYIYSATQKICLAIAEKVDEETFKLIREYCEEKGIIPSIIQKEKLDLVLRLGIAELNKRDLESKGG